MLSTVRFDTRKIFWRNTRRFREILTAYKVFELLMFSATCKGVADREELKSTTANFSAKKFSTAPINMTTSSR